MKGRRGEGHARQVSAVSADSTRAHPCGPRGYERTDPLGRLRPPAPRPRPRPRPGPQHRRQQAVAVPDPLAEQDVVDPPSLEESQVAVVERRVSAGESALKLSAAGELRLGLLREREASWGVGQRRRGGQVAGLGCGVPEGTPLLICSFDATEAKDRR